MGDTDQNPNGSFTVDGENSDGSFIVNDPNGTGIESTLNSTFTRSLNSTFTRSLRKRKEDPKLTTAKVKNQKLANLHQRTQLFLAKLEKCEDNYIESEIAKIEQRIAEFGEQDFTFYRAQSRETLLQMLEMAEAVEAKMYDDLDEIRDLVLPCTHKPTDRKWSNSPE